MITIYDLLPLLSSHFIWLIWPLLNTRIPAPGRRRYLKKSFIFTSWFMWPRPSTRPPAPRVIKCSIFVDPFLVFITLYLLYINLNMRSFNHSQGEWNNKNTSATLKLFSWEPQANFNHSKHNPFTWKWQESKGEKGEKPFQKVRWFK